MKDTLVKLIGWKATILQGDPTVVDRWRWLKRHLRPGPLRTLDAGCGTGAFTFYAAAIGNEAVGISFDPHQLQAARRRASILRVDGIEFREVDLRRLNENADAFGRFDQIVVFETIEHIRDDQKLVRDLAVLVLATVMGIGVVLAMTADAAHPATSVGQQGAAVPQCTNDHLTASHRGGDAATSHVYGRRTSEVSC